MHHYYIYKLGSLVGPGKVHVNLQCAQLDSTALQAESSGEQSTVASVNIVATVTTVPTVIYGTY